MKIPIPLIAHSAFKVGIGIFYIIYLFKVRFFFLYIQYIISLNKHHPPQVLNLKSLLLSELTKDLLQQANC